MPTNDDLIDPSLATSSSEDPTPPATSEPSQEPTETVEELKEKLAAAENEAKRWKGRVEKTKKADPVTEEDIDWKLKFNSRVDLVKEAYEKELQELQDAGAPLSNALKTKALMYAERDVGVQNVSSVSLPSPTIDRTATREVPMTDTDRAFGLKPETKKEFAQYVEGI